jgi:thiamine pyrophosphate-dependent acetolactate synthase large subunit-like protein
VQVYEAMAETLRQLGTEALFGLLGATNLRLVAYWQAKLGRPYYAARHEAGAVAMADGYARVSGQVGVATVTEGPGLTNTLTALTEAVKASTPLLLLAGDAPRHVLRHPHDVDQAAVCSALGAGVQRARGPETIADDLARAYQRALAEERPILFAVAADVMPRPCPPVEPGAVRPPRRQPVQPNDAAIRELADLVQGARRPVVLGGRGAVRAGARAPLERLADRIGALLATTGQAKGLFAGHPYYVGGSGVFSSPLAERLLGQADLVLAFGASLNFYTTRNRELYAPTARVVQVDSRPAALGAFTALDLGVVGDAAATAETLLAELERRGGAGPGFHDPALAREIAAYRPPAASSAPVAAGTVDPCALMVALEELLPRERTVVQDSGQSLGYPATYLSAPDATGYVFANDFMAVGLGQSMAFGAAVARPDRLAVSVMGDGGMLMSLGELDAPVRHGLPLLIVVLNDSAYGIEVQILAQAGQPVEPALFQDRDLATIARAAGAQGVTVRDVTDLAPLREWLRAPAGPLLLDCKIDPRLRAAWFHQVVVPDSWFQRLVAH